MEADVLARSSPLKSGAEGATFQPPEFLVSFEEVAIYFSKEEWDLLTQGQRALYKDVMLENSANSLSLEYLPKPDFILLEGGQDLFLQGSEERERLPGSGQEDEPPQQAHVVLQKKHKHKGGRETFGGQSRPEGLKGHLSQNQRKPTSASHGAEALEHLILDLHERKGRHTCSFCAKRFSCPSSLARHRRVHTGEKPYECRECGKSFARCHHLTRHKTIHAVEKPYECKACGKSYGSREVLSHHQRSHREKLYHCTTCGKSFRCSRQLRIHQSIHTGQKPYPCGECEKSFRDLGTLAQHEAIHAGKRPYTCFQCGKSFTRSGTLNRHQTTHTGEKPYRCVECGRKFTRQFSLTMHLRKHREQKTQEYEEHRRPEVLLPPI